jgi:hypothetical protein
MTVRPFFHSALALASTLLLGACPFMAATTATTAAATPAALTVVQGNSQSAQAGRPLATTLVLRVVDANGKGVAKQPATLVVSAGGGSVNPATAVSDSSGEMRLIWTLGSASSAQSLLATVNGTIGVTVSATALFPTDLVVAQGASQTAKIATLLKNDVVIRVIGANNMPMVGVPVTFNVTAGGGAITPQSGTTNALGEIATKWTLGGATGANTLMASSGSLLPVTISATATP